MPCSCSPSLFFWLSRGRFVLLNAYQVSATPSSRSSLIRYADASLNRSGSGARFRLTWKATHEARRLSVHFLCSCCCFGLVVFGEGMKKGRAIYSTIPLQRGPLPLAPLNAARDRSNAHARAAQAFSRLLGGNPL